IKYSAGTLTLTGTNTTGLITVHNGELQVDGGALEQPTYVSNLASNYIGRNNGDDATLVISNGGHVETVNSTRIGSGAGSQGLVLVSGQDSTLSSSFLIIIGGDGL